MNLLSKKRKQVEAEPEQVPEQVQDVGKEKMSQEAEADGDAGEPQRAPKEEEPSKEEQRQEILLQLDDLFEQLIELDPGWIPSEALVRFPIEIQPLNVDNLVAGYFKPWPLSELAKHPKNLDSPETRTRLNQLETMMDHGEEYMNENFGDTDNSDWNKALCYRLAWEFGMAPRQGTKDDRQPLRRIIGWRLHEGLPVEERFSTFLYNSGPPFWSPDYCSVISIQVPHIKVCMCHEFDVRPNLVMQEELFVIVAAMVTRLGEEALSNHLIIPVMLFTFTGKQQGRILVAHYDGDKLVIQMSQYYPFRSEDEYSMDLFTRYFASDIYDGGDTTKLPLKACSA